MWISLEKYYLYDAEQKSEEWLKVRIGRISGSNVSSVLGKDNFKSADKALLEIRGIEKPNLENNEHIIRGNYYEPIVRNYYENVTKFNVKELGFALAKNNNYIGASTDGVIYKNGIELDGIIEIKVPERIYHELLRKRHKKYIKTSHYDQMQWTMGILGKKWCDYVVASPNDKICIIERIPFNQKYFSEMITKINIIIENQLIPLLIKYDISLINPHVV